MVLRRALLPPMELQNEHMVDKKEDGPESTLMPKHHRFFKWQFQLATPNRPVSKLKTCNFRNRHLAEMD
eukprot:03243.XXX_111695_111410_1 [CDS] Oithona nana genome sequencing.